MNLSSTLFAAFLLLPVPGGEPDPDWIPLFDGTSLDGWRPSDFAGRGAVELREGDLLLEAGQPMTGVTWDGEPPRDDYELEVCATRMSGNDFFCGLTFPVGDDAATLILGGWGGALVGLSCIDGEDASANGTTGYRHFARGERYRVRVRVTRREIRAWLGDEPIVQVAREGRRFGIREDIAACLPLGVASFMTRAAVHSIRLRNLSPVEPVVPADQDDREFPEPLRGLVLSEGPSFSRLDPDWIPPSKVVVWARGETWQERFRTVAGDVELVFAADREQVREACRDADAVIGTCSAEIVQAGERLRWIQVGSAGVERYLAIAPLMECDIVLTNGKRLAGVPIAEHAMALLLVLSRGLRSSIPLQDSGDWSGRSELVATAEPFELDGRTLLVLGLGGIGEEVARRAHAFGMRILATRRSGRHGPDFVERVGLPEEMLALAAEADVVVDCLPHTDESDRLLDRGFFAALKEGAILINVGRGRTVDTAALVAALESGRLRAAGLDVTDPEPLPSNHPLRRMRNVVITPHIASRSDAQTERRMWLFVENLRRFVEGEPLLNVVDKAAGY